MPTPQLDSAAYAPVAVDITSEDGTAKQKGDYTLSANLISMMRLGALGFVTERVFIFNSP